MNFSLQCKNKFWFENINELFYNIQIIPLKNTILEHKLNALTRLIIIIFLFILIFGKVKESFIFLILSLLFIIILYYIQKNSMNSNETENYQHGLYKKYSQDDVTTDISKESKTSNTFVSPNMKVLTQEYLKSKNNPPKSSHLDTYSVLEFSSANQKLAGKANPRTLIAPVIRAPIADLEFWRANNFITHSHINSESQYDEYLSGYKISSKYDDRTRIINQDIEHPTLKNDISQKSNITSSTHNEVIEPFEYTNPYVNDENFEFINSPFGYNSNQIQKSNLPSNLTVGECELTPHTKEYNKNLFTQYIQQDIFTRNEIIEPINSNIGISHNQQFQPKTVSRDETGITYIEHDPTTFTKEYKKELDNEVTEYNVYDPRFTGYGTSYRSYYDKNIGQPKFYYDDVNAIRMPNYITRSNIDFAKYADSYGPLSTENKYGNINTADIRSFAQESFLNSSIQQRESLSESLMRKRNSELWQTRKYPIRTFG